MNPTKALASTGGRRRFGRSARGYACALGMMFCLAPGAALAEDETAPAQGAAAEDETAPMPFQLPVASASAVNADLEPTGTSSFPLSLLLLSGALVAGTLSFLFRSLSQREQAHPAPSQGW